MKYTYKDNCGHEYPTTTMTSGITYESGANIAENVQDAGDYSAQLRDTDDGPYWGKVLSIGPMGSSKGK